MLADAQLHPDPPAPRTHVPLLVLGGSLLLTLATAYQVNRTASASQRMRHESAVAAAVADVSERVQQRANTYVALLRGLSGLYAAQDPVGFDEFHAYAAHLDLQGSYAGVRGIGFAPRVGAADVEAVERAA